MKRPRFRCLVGLTIVISLWGATRVQAQWLFRPLGRDGTTVLASPEIDDRGWDAVALPHRTWDAAQPANSVYGWYRLHFTPDPDFAGSDMVLKLGVIDDADETYCNGETIGGAGAFPPQFRSAYNVDREYVIPASLLRYGEDNVIAVKVFDGIGTGGLLGAPRLGYRLSPVDEWLFQACGAEGQADLSAADLDDQTWDRAPMPDDAWDARQPDDDVFGWYRLHFVAPRQPERAPALDLGIVLDADETYLNGHLIGSAGSFPPDARDSGSEPRLYAPPPDAVAWGDENVLAVKVFNGRARGGIWGRPAWLHVEGAEASDGLAAARQALAAGRWEEAARAFEQILRAADDDATVGDALDGLTIATAALGRWQEALVAFSTLMREYPAESCSLAAVQAVAGIQEERGGLDADCFYLGQDRNTRGDWWLRYGNSGFVLSAMGGDCDIFGEPGWCAFVDPTTDLPLAEPPFRFTVSTFDAETSHLPWQWAASTSDRRALRNPLSGSRTATCVDDKGEEHPFDNEGPDLRFEMQVTEGWHRVAFYVVDWDWWNTWHPRVQGVILTDDRGSPLAVADTGKFGQGVWVQFAVKGPRTVVARIGKQRSPCAVLSGVFLDAAWLPPPCDTLGIGAPSEAVAPLRAAYEGVAHVSPDVRGRAADVLAALDAAAQDEALAAADALAVAWMRWGLASLLQEDVAEAGSEFIATLQQASGDAYVEELARLEQVMRDDRRFEHAALLMQALGAAWQPAVGRGDEAVIADLAPRLATWAEIDPAFASAMLMAMLAATEPLPAGPRASAIVSLGGPFVDQEWRMPRCRLRGERPLLHQGQDELPSLPSLATHVEDALLATEGLERADCPEHVVAFAQARAEKAEAVSRSLFRAGGSPEGCEVALRGVQMARLAGLPEEEEKLLWLAVASARGQRPLLDRVLALVDPASTAVLTVEGLAGELELCGDLEAGANLLESALEQGDARPDRERLRLARARAGLLERMGRAEDARTALLESLLPIATLQDEQSGLEVTRALRMLGRMCARAADAEGLRSLLDFAGRIATDAAPGAQSGLQRETVLLDEALRRIGGLDPQEGGGE